MQNTIDQISTPINKYLLEQTDNTIPYFELTNEQKTNEYFSHLVAMICPECNGALEIIDGFYKCKHCGTRFIKQEFHKF